MAHKILLIEPSIAFVELFSQTLQRSRPSVIVTQAGSIKDGIKKIMLSAYDVLCLNVGFPECSHVLDLFFKLREAKPFRLIFYPINTSKGRAYILNRGLTPAL